LPSSLVRHQSRTSCDDFVRNTRPRRAFGVNSPEFAAALQRQSRLRAIAATLLPPRHLYNLS
jgi:hypothetical protein